MTSCGHSEHGLNWQDSSPLSFLSRHYWHHINRILSLVKVVSMYWSLYLVLTFKATSTRLWIKSVVEYCFLYNVGWIEPFLGRTIQVRLASSHCQKCCFHFCSEYEDFCKFCWAFFFALALFKLTFWRTTFNLRLLRDVDLAQEPERVHLISIEAARITMTWMTENLRRQTGSAV